VVGVEGSSVFRRSWASSCPDAASPAEKSKTAIAKRADLGFIEVLLSVEGILFDPPAEVMPVDLGLFFFYN
jgi:hypothetical protein